MQKNEKFKVKKLKIINTILNMASKMKTYGGEDSIVGFNKKISTANYTNNYDSEYDSEEEEDYYDNYEPYEDEFNYNDGDYEPFVPEEEEEKKAYVSPRFNKIKLITSLNSPTKKSVEKSPTKSPTWWDKTETITADNRMVNGVLNYAALLPPKVVKIEEPKSEIQPKKSKKNNKKGKQQPTEPKVVVKPTPKSVKPREDTTTAEVQKPTRFCLSVIKKSRCFHGKQCRFAHDYSDLKECNFGEKCKKIVVLKTNQDGTVELANKNEVTCNFRHAKESKNSYLKRVPQQHTSPKK